MRALKYFVNEAAESLLRSWRSASLAILTIAAGLFVLGFFLMVNTNLQRVVGRWSEAAEMSVYLKDDATQEQVQALEALIDQSGLADEPASTCRRTTRSSDSSEDFPDLARRDRAARTQSASGVDRSPARARRRGRRRPPWTSSRRRSGPSRASPTSATTGAG